MDEVGQEAGGLLAAIQSARDFAASASIGVIWTLASPSVAFGIAAAAMALSLAALLATRRASRG